jgi:hypothetical protein
MTLLALLQAADGLDSRSVAPSAILVRRKGRVLRVRCLVQQKLDKAKRVLTRPRKFKLMRRVLGIDVRVRVELVLEESRLG